MYMSHLFKKHDDKTLEKIYERDKETGAFVISVAIHNYVDIFNELDSAPFRVRDLDRDLRVFLEESSSDIPLNHDIIIKFAVTREKQDEEKEEKVKSGLKTYFTTVRNQLRRDIRGSYQKSVVYTLTAFLLLLASYSLRPLFAGNIALITLVDGLTIGGWVFLWEAISNLVFKGRHAREMFRHYQRFSSAPIHFHYFPKEKSPPAK
jgi:hypothetical protein